MLMYGCVAEESTHKKWQKLQIEDIVTSIYHGQKALNYAPSE